MHARRVIGPVVLGCPRACTLQPAENLGKIKERAGEEFPVLVLSQHDEVLAAIPITWANRLSARFLDPKRFAADRAVGGGPRGYVAPAASNRSDCCSSDGR